MDVLLSNECNFNNIRKVGEMMDRSKLKKCTNCKYGSTCYLLKVVHENNEIRVMPPYITRFLAAAYDLANICQIYAVGNNGD